MNISLLISSKIPDLKQKLKSAYIPKKPEVYIKECLMSSFFLSFGMSFLIAILLLKMEKNPYVAILFFILGFMFFMFVLIKRIDVIISRKAREIDRDVLFAGRFLLVKLNSGKPLINSIFDASKSYGVASKFFKEIVDDIELGTPLEDALEKAYKFTPSVKFRRMLFQISNALKIGVDVSSPLEAILDEIAQEQLVEIQRYGKKLNSLTMFYMLSAIVLPSLGVTLFSVIASMVAFPADLKFFLSVLFFLIIIQLGFLSIFRSIRPNLNI